MSYFGISVRNGLPIGLGNLTAFASAVNVMWTPKYLFGNGEQGAWYDPSDFSTMFQDSAGTTPVTAVEQPVGLMLDKSKGLVLGPELRAGGSVVTIGSPATLATYDTSTGAGAAYRLDSANLSSVAIPITAPGTYRLDIEVISGPLQIRNSPTGTIIITSVAAGRTTYLTNAPGTVLYFGAGANASGCSFTVHSIRELPGNHATQATTTKRPVLSARYNLLTKTENFSDAVWLKGNTTVTANATTSPNGTVTATEVLNTSTAQSHLLVQNYTFTSGVVYTFSIFAKKSTLSFVQMTTNNAGVSGAYANFDLSAGILGTPSSNASIADCGSGWYKCSFTFTAVSTAPAGIGIAITTSATASRQQNYAGIGDGIYIWGASLVPADQADLPYQRVNTATDYDTVGFKPYLKFDGIDDALYTSSIDFTGTDKMTVVVGVRKLSGGTSSQCVVELSSTFSNNNVFMVYAPDVSALYEFGSKGATPALATTINPAFASPHTGVVTGLGNISTPSATLRVNGAQVASVTSSQGTGNYGNYPLYIGSRAGTSYPFNGHLYSLIIRGAASTDAQIVSAETYVNSKTGAY